MNETWCSPAQLTAALAGSALSYLTLQTLDTIFSILTILTTLVNFQLTRIQNRIAANLKTLLRFHHVVILAYSFSFSSIEIYHLSSRFFLKNCDLLVPAHTCIWFRIVQSFANVYTQLFYTGIMVDTWFHMYLRAYRRCHYSAHILCCLQIVVAFAAVIPSLPIDLASHDYLVNCASLENKNKSVQRGIFAWFGVLNAISLLAFYFLFNWKTRTDEKIQMKRQNRDDNEIYELKNRSDYVNNHGILSMIFPHLLMNIFAYSYYAASSIYLTTKDTVDAVDFLKTYTIPLYLFCASLFWTSTLLRNKSKVRGQITNKEYFDAFKGFLETSHEEHLRTEEKAEKKEKKKTDPKIKISATPASGISDHTVSGPTTAAC